MERIPNPICNIFYTKYTPAYYSPLLPGKEILEKNIYFFANYYHFLKFLSLIRRW